MPSESTLSPDSPFWEKCARHTNRHTSRNLAYMYLCDTCTPRLIREALNDRPPVFSGTRRQGYCGLCNKLTEVTFRQWFACPICWNVIVAYQKSITAGAAVQQFWDEQVKLVAPTIELVELDEMQLLPLQPRKGTKRQSAAAALTSDYRAEEVVGGQRTPRFHIELKSGPGSIDEMREFQLDVNDYNDIVGPVLNTGLIGYIFHVHVDLDWMPPTRRAVARKMWWTDILTLTGNKVRQAKRRDEDKQALYFRPEAFRPMDEFLAEMRQRRFFQRSQEIPTSGLRFIG
jgi:hypothetical protein